MTANNTFLGIFLRESFCDFFFYNSFYMQDSCNGKEASPKELKDSKILYGIDENPPWYLSIPMAFQVKEI